MVRKEEEGPAWPATEARAKNSLDAVTPGQPSVPYIPPVKAKVYIGNPHGAPPGPVDPMSFT